MPDLFLACAGGLACLLSGFGPAYLADYLANARHAPSPDLTPEIRHVASTVRG